jgi:hypothetical protein
VHAGFSVLFLLIIVVFKEINERSVIDAVLQVAGYTYGPLLGLFTFGLLSKRKVHGVAVPFIAIACPLISWLISSNSADWFGGYKIGYEVLVINGGLMYLGLFLVSKRAAHPESVSAGF